MYNECKRGGREGGVCLGRVTLLENGGFLARVWTGVWTWTWAGTGIGTGIGAGIGMMIV